MNHVDLARFEFDYDTTWTSFFLDADLNIYSRYGGRDSRNADARMNRESLLHTMQEVLQIHQKVCQTPSAERTPLIQAATHPLREQANSPEDMPLLQQNHQGCVHCHQVQEYRLLQAYQDGKFDQKMIFNYPLPESLGIELKTFHGHQVEKVTAASAAARAGLLAGDVISRVNDVAVRSEYDIRWALQHAPDKLPISVTVVRQSAAGAGTWMNLSVQPAAGWRKSDLGWRKSLRSVPLQMGFLGYSLSSSAVKEMGFDESKSLVKVVALRPPGLAKNLGLQKGDFIAAVGGQTGFRTFEHLKSKLLEIYQPGDIVEVEVLRDGKTLLLKGELPEWFTEETTVP